MIEHSKWLRETFPVSFAEIGPILKSGFIYVSGRDNMYRPLVVLNIRRLIDGNYPIELINSSSAFFCDFVVKKLLVPGQVENWIMIIDLNDVGIFPITIIGFHEFIQSFRVQMRNIDCVQLRKSISEALVVLSVLQNIAPELSEVSWT